MSLQWDDARGSFDYIALEYRARPIRVVDGDTCDLIVDMGLRNHREERFRLLAIDTPELHDKDPAKKDLAIQAKNRLTALFAMSVDYGASWPLKIITLKGDSFGRWLVTIFFVDSAGVEQNINLMLVNEGLAVPFRP